MHKPTECLKSSTSIPDKLFYKIGEVSRIVGVKPYVLRYWETEFPFLRPRKNKSGQRVYIKKDVELLLQIKRLLYQEGFTIEGARKKVACSFTSVANKAKTGAVEFVKKRLREILLQLQ